MSRNVAVCREMSRNVAVCHLVSLKGNVIIKVQVLGSTKTIYSPGGGKQCRRHFSTGGDMAKKASRNRPDQDGTHRAEFDKNKRKIYATRSTCALCGKPVDMQLRYPDPMSKSIDHIVPIAKGGHPSAMSNLQLAHLICNKHKSDRIQIVDAGQPGRKNTIGNRNLPQSMDWTQYRSK